MKKFFSLLLLLLMISLVGCTNTKDGKKDDNNDKPVDIIVTYISNGETVNSQKVDKGEIIFPEDLERDGYTFVGWFYDELFSQSYNFEEIEESITLYAKWTAHEYIIRFFTNGGSSIPQVKVSHGDTITKPADPTKDRFEFAGWYKDPNLTVEFNFSDPVLYELSLYAKWEEEKIPLVDMNEFDAYYIVSSFGYDAATTLNINYHTKNTKTSVEYTTLDDENYTNKKTVKGVMEGFEASIELEKAFERRNVVKVTLNNLTPNTKYKYRINKGDNTYTEDYYFKTSGNNSKTSFLFMTDVHYYDGFDGAEISEEVKKQAMKIQPNLDFVLQTGDIVDTGGNSEDWHKMFTFGKNSLSSLPHHNIPGNHEHYIIGPYRNKIFSSYYNFPDNGEGEYKGTSHYFIHNDTLFIQVDTDLTINQGQQLEWLENVLKNNPTKFIVVGTHSPVNETNTSDYNRAFMSILEKYGVDLVLVGHYHSDSFKTLYLDEKPLNDKIGVTYLRGEGGGVKSIGDKDPLDFAKGYIIDILDDKIQIRKINARGTVLQTRTVSNKKLYERQEATKQELMDSISGAYDANNETILFTWSEKFFKNVKELVIYENYRDQRTMSFIIPTPGYTYHKFDKIKFKYEHSFTFKVTFSDDTVLERTIEYDMKGGMGLEASDLTSSSVKIKFAPPLEEDVSLLKNYEVYINGVLYKTYNAKDTSNKPITEIDITGLTSNTEYNITVKTISRLGYLYGDSIKVKTN